MTLKRSPLARSPLARKSGLSRGKPLAQRSPERIAEDDGPWQETKRLVDERDRGCCWGAMLIGGRRCTRDRHPHHVTPRKHGGDRLAVDNVASVCSACHDHIHNVIGWQTFRALWESHGGGQA